MSTQSMTITNVSSVIAQAINLLKEQHTGPVAPVDPVSPVVTVEKYRSQYEQWIKDEEDHLGLKFYNRTNEYCIKRNIEYCNKYGAHKDADQHITASEEQTNIVFQQYVPRENNKHGRLMTCTFMEVYQLLQTKPSL
ncbi:hypothetical protein BDC45DRAFT_542766 [Circinella umbellata]|nr:hypothetical protein BDC45DRAFT_542766 [Circinella umbellata]